MTLLASSVSLAQTVAEVNGQPIDSSRVDSLLEQCKPLALIGDRSCADDADFSSMLGRILLYEPLRQEAQKLGLSQDKQNMGESGEDFLEREVDWPENALLKELIRRHNPSDKEINAMYKRLAQQVKELKGGVQEKTYREIVAKTQKEAELALAEIKAGKSFAEVAKAHSIEPDAPLKTARVTLESATGVEELKPGQVSDRPWSEPGRHIIYKVESSKPATIPPLSQSKKGVVELLKNQAAKKRIKELYKQSKVESDDKEALRSIREKQFLSGQDVRDWDFGDDNSFRFGGLRFVVNAPYFEVLYLWE